MLRLQCPSCGAPVEFKSKVTVFAVCSHCLMTMVRRDVDIETLGQMAVLPDDMSPLQIGSEGFYEGRRFEVIGRIKVGWSEGNWNEWYVLFDNLEGAWLAEAQGFWMMSFPSSATFKIASFELQIKPGLTVRLSTDVIYTIDDVKVVHVIASEGELPREAAAGRKGVSVDLSRNDGKFATLEFSERGAQPAVFEGRFVEFEEFKFRNLREIDGW